MQTTTIAAALAVLALAVPVCARAPMQDSSDTPLIPRQVLLGNPDKAAPDVSPDGTRIAFLAPLEGVLNVWVAPARRLSAAKPVTADKGRGIQQFFWAFTNRHILYLQDKNGDENWRVYAVDLASGKTQDLTPFEGVNAQVQEVSPKHPEEILVGLNNRVPQLHDVYRINIVTGDRKLVLQNPGFVGFMTDDDLTVRLAMTMTPDGGAVVLKPKGEKDWEPWQTIPSEDVLTTGPMGFDRSGEYLYARDSRGRDTSALTRVHLRTGASQVLFEDSRADFGGLLVHPTEKTVQAASVTYDRTHWYILDSAIAPDLALLQALSPGELVVSSRSLDDRMWTLGYNLDNGPVRYYLYDRKARRATFLFTNRKALEDMPLVRMRCVTIPSRDGLKMVSYLTLPADCDGNGDGVPDRPLPLVLFVHGGPWSRDDWGYNPVHQIIANRGYAALSVNFRGSTGFGKRFVNLADREWGGKMHDDLVDAVQWAVSQGIADAKRVAIMGASYGGYATLVGLTFTPELFACGADLVGPSNLVTFLNTIPPYWQPIIALMKQRVGDFSTEEGKAFLESRSPLTFAGRITKPLLIAQGKNDPRVNKAESDQIVKAMQDKGIPVTYLVYADEGHGFARPENTLSFFAAAEVFLAQHLGGRYEPIGEDFKGSSATVETGAELIPGLSEAIRAASDSGQ